MLHDFFVLLADLVGSDHHETIMSEAHVVAILECSRVLQQKQGLAL